MRLKKETGWAYVYKIEVAQAQRNFLISKDIFLIINNNL